ncbi:MAG: hypothetical protein LBT68_07255 [Spirochaetales bacterium]|jgi:hypothetical protein|nr:hypothetical protein [Spirochaetales bacterium]
MLFYAELKKRASFRFVLAALFAALPLSLCADEGVARPQRYVADGAVTSLYVENDGSMMCVSGGSSILRIGRDMKTLWRRDLSAKPALVFRRKDGVILVATEKGRLEAYNSQAERVTDFALPWKDADKQEESRLLALGETEEGWIFLCTAGGDCVVFNLEGDTLARWKTPQPPSCPPTLFQGKLAIAFEDGSLVFFTPSGRPVRNAPAAAPVRQLVVNAFTQTLAVARKGGDFEVYSAEPEGAGDAADSPETQPILRLHVPFEIAHILPLSSGGHVLVGADGRVLNLDAEGTAGKEFFLKDGNPAGASTDGSDALFFTESRERFSSYSLAGDPLWTTNLTGKPGTLAISPSSRYLAVGGEDWVIQRFEFVLYGWQISTVAPPLPPAEILKIIPAESVYRGEYDFIYLMDRAVSAAGDKKKECLDIIEDRLNTSLAGRSLDYMREVLSYIAAEQYIVKNARTYPDIQNRALALLGRMQDSGSRELLCAFLMQEKDETLLSGVLSAMRAVRSDPDGIMRRGIYNFVISRGDLSSRINSAVFNALDGISLYQGGLGQYGRTALLRILPGSPSTLRPRIQNILKDRP